MSGLLQFIARPLPLFASLVAAGGIFFVLTRETPSAAVAVEGLEFGEPVLEPAAAIIGRLQNAKFRVPFRNVSGRPLTFRTIASSCTCLHCEPVERAVAAGASGELNGEIRLPMQGREPTAGAAMNIELEGGDGKTFRSQLAVYVPVRPGIDFAGVRIPLEGDEGSGRTASFEFAQFELKDQPFAEPQADARGNFSARREGEFGPTQADGPFKKRSFRVRFASQETSVPGGRGGMVILFGGNSTPLELPVDWVDATRFSLQPNALMLRDGDPAASSAEVSLVPQDARPCRIAKATPERGDLFAAELPAADAGKKLLVRLVGHADKAGVSKIQLQVEHGGRVHPATLSVLYAPRGKKTGEQP